MRALPPNARFLLRDLLREVSRSFYLTLRVLPGEIRDQIGLAYLLARAADTIADTGLISRDERLQSLQQLREHINSGEMPPPGLGKFSEGQSSPAERTLLQRLPEIIELLARFPSEDQRLIRRVLETITSGQELDLRRFGGASEANIVALGSAAELDDYTYRVAGCVGDFWTRVCVQRLRPKPAVSLEELVQEGIRFGQGLQLVNILRDIPKDLRQGRSYLPAPELAAAGLAPPDLLEPLNEASLRPVYNRWIARAEEHLQMGWKYVLGLPGGWVRVRLACAWPILIGLQTLAKLRNENALDPARRIKVSRAEVKGILRASIFALPFREKWRRLPQSLARPQL